MADKAPKIDRTSLKGKVETVDIGHALRASLQFEQADGARTTSYSSLEIGLQMHVKIPEEYQEGDGFRQVIDAYADETLKLVDDRLKQDARRIGLVAITEQAEQDRVDQLDADSDGIRLDDSALEGAPATKPAAEPAAKTKTKGRGKQKKS